MKAKSRLKWSLIVGFLASCALHIAAAIGIAVFPYNDEPLTPRLVFIYLLLPGWAIAGRGYHVRLWQETFAAAINGVVYGSVVFCLLTWIAWGRAGNALSRTAYRMIAIVPFTALLLLIGALVSGLFPNASNASSTAFLIWALIVAFYGLSQQLRQRRR